MKTMTNIFLNFFADDNFGFYDEKEDEPSSHFENQKRGIIRKTSKEDLEELDFDKKKIIMKQGELYVNDIHIPKHLSQYVLDPTFEKRSEKNEKQRLLREQRLEKLSRRKQLKKKYYTDQVDEKVYDLFWDRSPAVPPKKLTRRQFRVSELLLDSFNTVLERDELEPSYHLKKINFHVDNVVVEVSMRTAKVYYSVKTELSDDQVKKIVAKSATHLRYLVTQDVQLKYSPIFKFYRHESEPLENLLEDRNIENDEFDRNIENDEFDRNIDNDEFTQMEEDLNRLEEQEFQEKEKNNQKKKQLT